MPDSKASTNARSVSSPSIVTIPRLFGMGALTMWAGGVAVVLSAAVLIADASYPGKILPRRPRIRRGQTRPLSLPAKLAIAGGVALAIGGVLAIPGWVSYRAARRRRVEAKLQVVATKAIDGDEIVPPDEALVNLIRLDEGEDGGSEKVIADYDVALGRRGMVGLVCGNIIEELRSREITGVIAGGLIGSLIASHTHGGRARKILEDRAFRRQAWKRTPLARRLDPEGTSLVIPLEDIVRIEFDGQKERIRIHHGFEKTVFAAEREAWERMRLWLKESRARTGLPADDPSPFTRDAIDAWTRGPGGALPDAARRELDALRGHPGVLYGLAKSLPNSFCRAVRQDPNPHPVAAELLVCVLNEKTRWSTGKAGMAAGILVLAGPMASGFGALIAEDVRRGTESDAGFAGLLAVAAGLAALFSLIALPVYLLLAWRARAQVQAAAR